MERKQAKYLKTVNAYARTVASRVEDKRSDAKLLLRIAEKHETMDKLSPIISRLRLKGFFKPPQNLLIAHPEDKLHAAFFEYLSEHGKSSDPVELTFIADHHGIEPDALRHLLGYFNLPVSGRLPMELPQEPRTKWRKKPR